MATVNDLNIEGEINSIFSSEQFLISQQDKEKKLLPILKFQVNNHITHSENLASYYNKIHFKPLEIKNISDIPPIPVQMFKSFDLRTCKEEDVTRILNSSATTTGIPSKIYVDKQTSFRQTKGLTTTTKNFIGKNRKPYLVIDEDVNKGKTLKLTARGAAIRGFATFASITEYIMDSVNGQLVLNKDKLLQFVKKHQNDEVLIFGFTYIIWSRLIQQAEKESLTVKLPNVKILHGGGWKKLREQSVSKEEFSKKVAEFFGTKPENVIDYYGMVEQLGVVFFDCEYGHKHVPDFADIILRDFYSMDEVQDGKEGLIECLSIIPSSYPGQALLTEDIGKILGRDNCPCGRKGKYFIFVARAEKAEIRGCGDTFAERTVTKSSENQTNANKLTSDNQSDEWDW